MLYLLSIIPILVFLITLILMDSFSLVKYSRLSLNILWGIFCCALCFFIYRWINPDPSTDVYFSPILEEFMKGMMLLVMFSKKKLAFVVDSLIYGAAIGSGFALFENIFYAYLNPEMELSTALFRGLSTAIMHAGTTAILGMVLHLLINKGKNFILLYPIAIFPSIILHIFYNMLYLQPFYMLIISLFGTTLISSFLVYLDEMNIGRWMDSKVFNEVELLASIKKGKFRETYAGKYLLSIKEQFEPERAFDMYCYISLFLELSLAAKRNMMLREAGLPEMKDEETSGKIKELYTLKKQIGTIGEIAVRPIVNLDNIDKWLIDSLIS